MTPIELRQLGAALRDYALCSGARRMNALVPIPAAGVLVAFEAEFSMPSAPLPRMRRPRPPGAPTRPT